MDSNHRPADYESAALTRLSYGPEDPLSLSAAKPDRPGRGTIQVMAEAATTRAAQYADQFVAAQDEFIRLIESLTHEQWHLAGKNFPERINDEDEGRSVGVIAHHVAINGDWIMGRIRTMLDGRPLATIDIHAVNAEQAAEHAGVSEGEVLQILRETKPRVAEAVRSIPDDQLDIPRQTPVGPMSAAQRIERVLIGHMKIHQGSIEAAIA
jgi:DinB family protein